MGYMMICICLVKLIILLKLYAARFDNKQVFCQSDEVKS